MSDPIHGHYRTREEVDEQKKQDPIPGLFHRLEGDGLMTEGPLKGVRVPLVQLRSDYFDAMGWNRKSGLLSKARADRLGLSDLLAGYVEALAACIADGTAPEFPSPPRRPLPEHLRRDVQRLPNCFRGFDQRPEDCALLVERARSARRPR